MQAVKTKNTGPELAVRRMLHALGYRFRLHCKTLPGCPDIVIPGRRKIIFVNGCFWHSHGCRKGYAPKSRFDYWEPKLKANRERDAAKSEQLTALGWGVLSVWQCEIENKEALKSKLVDFVVDGIQ
jgi:DNA mismatch endonuclease (patch repair protein)